MDTHVSQITIIWLSWLKSLFLDSSANKNTFVVIRTRISKQKGWLCDKARIAGGGREKEGDTGTQFWIIADLGEKNSYAIE